MSFVLPPAPTLLLLLILSVRFGWEDALLWLPASGFSTCVVELSKLFFHVQVLFRLQNQELVCLMKLKAIGPI